MRRDYSEPQSSRLGNVLVGRRSPRVFALLFSPLGKSLNGLFEEIDELFQTEFDRILIDDRLPGRFAQMAMACRVVERFDRLGRQRFVVEEVRDETVDTVFEYLFDRRRRGAQD